MCFHFICLMCLTLFIFLIAEKIKQMKTVPPGWEEFKPDAIWENVQPYLTAYFGKTGFLNFFKLCIIFPVESDSSDFTTFSDWMCTKFSLPRTENFPVRSFIEFTNTLFYGIFLSCFDFSSLY